MRSILELEDLQLMRDDIETWDSFWIYLKSHWCSLDECIQTWNILHKDNDGYDLCSHTNNGLEHCNRNMNELFLSPHPLLPFLFRLLKGNGGEL